MAVYGKGRYGGDRYGGGSGAGVISKDVSSGPISMTGIALVQAAGSRAVRMGATSMVGKALVTANITVAITLAGDVQMRLSPSAYLSVAIPPTTPESVGLTPVFIERVSPTMPTPTLQDGRPV